MSTPTTVLSMGALLWRHCAQLAARQTTAVLSISIALALVGAVLAAAGLKFNPNMVASHAARSDADRRWQAYQAEFGEREDTVVVLNSADPAALSPVVERLAEELTYPGRPFENVLAFADLSPWRAKAIHSLPLRTLQAAEQTLQRRTSLAMRLTNFQQQLQSLSSPELNRWLVQEERPPRILTANDETALLSELYQSLAPFSRQPIYSADHQQAYIFLQLKHAPDELLPGGAALKNLHQLLEDIENRHPAVSIRVAGAVPREIVTQRQSLLAAGKSWGLGLLGACLLLGLSFANWRQAGSILLTLTVSLGWWLGWMTIAVGQATPLTLLSGLCILPPVLGCAVYYRAYYQRQRMSNSAVPLALVETAIAVGPTLFVGGLSSALAMFALRGSGNMLLSEFGLCVCGGILTGLLAIMLTLPAAICWFEGAGESTSQNEVLAMSLVTWLPQRLPLAVLLCAALAVCCGLPGLSRVQLDFFSAPTYSNVNDASESCAYVMCDNAEQWQMIREQMASSELVGAVDSFVPPPPVEDPQRRRTIVKLATLIEELSSSPTASLATRWTAIETETARMFEQLQARNVAPELLRRIQQSYDSLAQEINYAEGQDAALTLSQWRSLLPFLDPAPPSLNELSPELVSRTVGRTNKLLLRVLPREDVSQRAALYRFVSEVERMAPEATGPAVNRWHRGRKLQAAYLQATLYSLLSVAMLHLLWWQSIPRSALSMLPCLAGLAAMYACAGWCDVTLTPTSCLAWLVVAAASTCCGVMLFGSDCDSAALAITISMGLALLMSVAFVLSVDMELRGLGRLIIFGLSSSWAAALFVAPALLSRPSHVAVTVPLTTPATSVPAPTEVLLSVEATPTLMRPHRRLIQPTRVDKSRPPQDRAA